jgi:DNA-binding transcriptional LysR family regulator
VRTRLTEHGDRDAMLRQIAGGTAMAVLSVDPARPTEGLEEHVCWKERLSVVVHRRHPLATHRGPVPVDRLAADPLLARLSGPDDHPAVLRVLRPHVTVDSPHALVELARAGGAAAILGDVALHRVDLTDLVVLAIDEKLAVRATAAYWGGALLRTGAGRRLHTAVLETSLPPGAQPPGVPDEALRVYTLRAHGRQAAER